MSTNKSAKQQAVSASLPVGVVAPIIGILSGVAYALLNYLSTHRTPDWNALGLVLLIAFLTGAVQYLMAYNAAIGNPPPVQQPLQMSLLTAPDLPTAKEIAREVILALAEKNTPAMEAPQALDKPVARETQGYVHVQQQDFPPMVAAWASRGTTAPYAAYRGEPVPGQG